MLDATQGLEAQRVVVAIEAGQQDEWALRIIAVGSALAAMLPTSLVGCRLDGTAEQFGTPYAAFAQVARSGEPGHEFVVFDFGPEEQLRYERLIVPVADDAAGPRPTHLVALISFDPAL